ncbi:MAG: S41 family peptidase [Clostridia bacterium]|nr:S41 family peptidase [Clostridia bacterium]
MEQKSDNTASTEDPREDMMSPAPDGGDPEEGRKSRKTLKRVIIIISCLVIVAAVFCGGWFGGLYWGNAQFRSYKWALGLIEDYYYGDYDTSVSENSAYALAAMLDEYSEYYSAEEYAALVADNAGSKSGIGVTYQFVTDDTYGDTGCLIVSVVGNSPAYYAGIRAGDVISSGTSGGRTTTFTSATEFQSFVSAQETDADFTLTATDGTAYTLARENYQAAYTIMYTSEATYSFTFDASGSLQMVADPEGGMSDLPEGFAYIQLQSFYGTAATEMDKLIGEFNSLGCTSLILDLRSNGGGSVSVMERIAGCFMQDPSSQTLAMVSEDKNGKRSQYYVYTTNQYTLAPDTEIYILANNGTASASEALMGYLLSYDLTDYGHIYLSNYEDNPGDNTSKYLTYTASSKNSRTYGKGIMQSTYVNSWTGEALKLTVAKIYWPDGSCIHDTGITAADGCNTISTPWVITSGDTELRTAIREIAGN